MNGADHRRLEEVIYRIEKIKQFVYGISEYEFLNNEILKDACHANLIVIAEAMARISTELKNGNPDISWRQIIGFRNQIIHEYFRINWLTVWQIITDDLSTLKSNVQKILNTEG